MAEKTRKTAQEKAQAALDRAEAAFERARKAAIRAHEQSDAATAAYNEALQARDYAAAHPALKKEQDDPEDFSDVQPLQ